MCDLSDNLNAVAASLTLKSCGHRGDVIMEALERFHLPSDVLAEPRGVVMVKDRDLGPHRCASWAEGVGAVVPGAYAPATCRDGPTPFGVREPPTPSAHSALERPR